MELRVILMILISLSSLESLVSSMSNGFTISVHKNDLIDDRLEGNNVNGVEGEEPSYLSSSASAKSTPFSDVHLLTNIDTKSTVRLVRISIDALNI